jgi:hypothetical protein
MSIAGDTNAGDSTAGDTNAGDATASSSRAAVVDNGNDSNNGSDAGFATDDCTANRAASTAADATANGDASTAVAVVDNGEDDDSNDDGEATIDSDVVSWCGLGGGEPCSSNDEYDDVDSDDGVKMNRQLVHRH